MWTRRQFLTRSTLGILGATGTALAFPGQGGRETMPDGSQARGMITDECERKVRRGLEYLAGAQKHDGSWGTHPYVSNVAVTSLGALALMAGGSMPGRGPFGDHVKRALDFILQLGSRAQRGVMGPFGGGGQFPEGFLFNGGGGGGQQGPMYSHGFGTLFLGEVCGMLSDPAESDRVRAGLSKAVKIIRDAQHRSGGWRYTPQPLDADISVTVCQIMALRSARNAGVFVPKSVVDRCIEYVKKSQNGDGSFAYQLGNRAFPFNGGGFARTAAGIAALYSAGIYNDEQIQRGLTFLANRNNRPVRFQHQAADMHYFYGHYYAVQVMWTAGGDYWADWFPSIREELLKNQDADGSWADSICREYGTAMACIILQVPNNYLPILQK
jgi:hypothetical protein